MTALLAEHLADLVRSGLTEEDAAAAGIRSADAAEISKIVGFTVPSSGYVIPYPGTHALRVRMVPELVFANGDKAKYLSPKGAPVRLYIPPGVVDELRADPARPLYVTEGEKKALALRKALGISIIAVAGVWCWPSKERASGVIEDLELLMPLLRGRTFFILFDENARTNIHVARAAEHLATWASASAGAIARWAFPPCNGAKKVGIDDLLVEGGVEAVEAVFASAREPEDAACFVFREAVATAKTEHTGTAFVGTARADKLRRLLGDAKAGARRSLADEAKRELKLTAGDRAALLEGLTAKEQEPDAAQGNALTFRDPEPWDGDVEGDVLLDEVFAAVRKYLVLPAYADVALVLWIAFTWAFEAFYFSPRLAATSPTRRCGKTTLLMVLKALVRRALLAANVTPSVVFRTTEAYRPTLLVDEWDSFAQGNDELRNVINAGHCKGVQVLRSDGETFEPRAFSAWSPAALAGIGKLPSTIADRSVEISMQRKKKSDRVSRLRGDRIDAEMEHLRRKLAAWTAQHFEALRDLDPSVPDSLDDRGADNWRPLLAIAEMAGGRWPELARLAAMSLSSERGAADDDSLGVALLRDVRDVFASADRLPSKTLVERLLELEGRPWSELPDPYRGRPLTQTTLARLLRNFSISPKSIRLDDGSTPKGYTRDQFLEAWETYLPTEATSRDATTPQVNGHEAPKPAAEPQPAARVASPGPVQSAGERSGVSAWRSGGGEAEDLDAGALFEERSAVREFDGGQTREDAEAAARAELSGSDCVGCHEPLPPGHVGPNGHPSVVCDACGSRARGRP